MTSTLRDVPLERKADGLAVKCDGEIWTGTFIDCLGSYGEKRCWEAAQEVSYDGETPEQIRARGGKLVRVALVEVK